MKKLFGPIKSMKKIFAIFLALLGFLLLGCDRLHTPDNDCIIAAVQASLANENDPPDLDFDSLEVPMRSMGEAHAVLWTNDKKIQRNYVIRYDKKTQSCQVVSYTTSVFDEEERCYKPSED